METFAVFGNPVGHSLSPLMHNAAFAALGIEARYIARQASSAEEVIAEMRRFGRHGMRGASITIPFKISVMELLDEVGRDAREIGAVNTVVNDRGRLLGRNTDWSGFVEDLEDAGLEITGRTFRVLGAGGAARAIVFGLLKRGGLPVVYCRADKGAALAREFGCGHLPLEEIGTAPDGVLVNTTPVGMYPRPGESPMSGTVLGRFECVVDLVYNPLRTKLLADAEKAGCKTRSGLGMLVNQGAGQIRLWTGKEPPRKLMRAAVESELRKRMGKGL